MIEQVPVICRECGKVYTARKRDDSSFILSTRDSKCECGNDAFVEVDTEGEAVSG